MSEAYVSDLVAALKRNERCDAAWIEAAHVVETFKGETVWEGDVQVFDLRQHPGGITRAYGWHSKTDDGRLRLTTVLHKPPVDSPETAVRAAIAAEYRGKA